MLLFLLFLFLPIDFLWRSGEFSFPSFPFPCPRPPPFLVKFPLVIYFSGACSVLKTWASEAAGETQQGCTSRLFDAFPLHLTLTFGFAAAFQSKGWVFLCSISCFVSSRGKAGWLLVSSTQGIKGAGLQTWSQGEWTRPANAARIAKQCPNTVVQLGFGVLSYLCDHWCWYLQIS